MDESKSGSDDENTTTQTMQLPKSFLSKGAASDVKDYKLKTTDDLILLSSDDDDDFGDLPFELDVKLMPMKTGLTDEQPSTSSSALTIKFDLDANAASTAEGVNTYTLDMLLDEKEHKNTVKKELDEMGLELKEFLRKGGIAKLSINTGEDDFLPQHKEQLKKFEVAEERINVCPPGEAVFHAVVAGSLFTFPRTLSLAACGFLPGTSIIDQRLASFAPDLQLQMVTSGCVRLCFAAMRSGNAVLNWAFLLLSVLSDDLDLCQLMDLLVDMLRDTLVSDWTPSVLDVTRILVNLGATFDEICPRRELISFTENQLRLSDSKENGATDRPVSPPGGSEDDRCGTCVNWQHVLRVLTEALIHRPQQYTSDDLTALLLMILKVHLDVNFMQDTLLLADFTPALMALLDAFPSTEWKQRVLDVCASTAALTSHHHNAVRLVEVLPPGERGHYFQRRLSLVLLQRHVLHRGVPRETLVNLKARQLFPVIQSLLSWEHSDFYFIASVVILLDMCIGNEPLKSAEKNDLQSLIDGMSRLKSSVRESVNVLDRSTVKDMMVQLASQWSLMLLDMGPKQRTLFAWTSSHRTERTAIEHVGSTQSNDDGDDDDDASQTNADVEMTNEDEAPKTGGGGGGGDDACPVLRSC